MSLLQGVSTRLTHRISTLPVLVLMPHSTCNCRCVMCDIWKANNDRREISVDQLNVHAEAFRKLGVKHVTFSGGEALLHPNLWALSALFRDMGARVSLLTAGLSLQRHAPDVVRHVDDVIVSIDGSAAVHNAVRNVPQAFEKLSEGIHALRRERPGYRITGRCVIQKANFRDFIPTLEAARELGLDQISFLPADVSSQAFNREVTWGQERAGEVALSDSEITEFTAIAERAFTAYRNEFNRHWIAESPEKIYRMIHYFRAIRGQVDFESPPCNAPWVSAVIESTGDIRPCFFHQPYGHLREGLFNVLNSPSAVKFRKTLDMRSDSICKRCVCALKRPLSFSG